MSCDEVRVSFGGELFCRPALVASSSESEVNIVRCIGELSAPALFGGEEGGGVRCISAQLRG